MRQPNLQHMNPYQQGLMAGQFNPLQALMQNKQAQNFTPQPPLPFGQPQQAAQSPEVNPMGQSLNQGVQGWLKAFGKDPDSQKKQVAGQVAGAMLPPSLPFQQSGLDILKMAPGAQMGFM